MSALDLILLASLAGLAWWVRRLYRRLRDVMETAAGERVELERRHAAAQREQQERLEAVLRQMLEGLIVVDTQGRIKLANRAAAQLFGFEGPCEGRPLLEVVRHHEFAALLARLEREQEVTGHELQIEGSPVRTIGINAVRLLDHRAQPAGGLFVMHDLTAQRAMEGMREEFVANVSHELRTPLSLIRGAAETLLDGARNDPAALEKFLGVIDRHASRLSLLIEDLLLLSALDSGRLVLRSEPVPLNALVDEVFEDFRASAAERGVELVESLDGPWTVRGDAGRLRQILSNLIDNAIKHGGPGAVTVGAALLDGGWVQVWVRDTGPGIPDEARSRVFERFFRVDRARARSQGGTGLGLAIVKNLVRAHGGDVRVESAPDRGATFYFKLPAA